MTTTVTVRPFQPADQMEVLDLLRAALGETDLLARTPDLFAWKHLDNPFGRSIMLVAEDTEGIVGFRAFMRWELSTPSGETLRCVRAVDTATHPRAQRRGIFRRLTEEAVDWARADDVDLIFNTPNPRSGAGYLTMGWAEVGRIGAMVRPRLRLMRPPGGRAPTVRDGKVWDSQQVVDREPVGLRTPRTPEYLRWRFACHPTASYQVVKSSGALAVVRPNVRNRRAELVVSDLFGPAAPRAVRAAARFSDATYLVGWFSRGAPERSAALAGGMMPVPGFTALTLFARPLHELPIDVSCLAAWDFALSDLELL